MAKKPKWYKGALKQPTQTIIKRKKYPGEEEYADFYELSLVVGDIPGIEGVDYWPESSVTIEEICNAVDEFFGDENYHNQIGVFGLMIGIVEKVAGEDGEAIGRAVAIEAVKRAIIDLTHLTGTFRILCTDS